MGFLLLLLACIAWVGTVTGFPVSFDSSIVTAVDTDYLLDGSGSSRCIEMVNRAARDPVQKLNFFPTLFWWDSGPANGTLADVRNCQGTGLQDYYCYNRFNATTVNYFCYSRTYGSNGSNCPPADAGQIARFKDSFTACFKAAVDKGFDIAITPHIDDGRGLGGWRNTLVFDPLVKYGGYNYEEVVLQPLVDAAAAALTPGRKIYFYMQGEMGATVFVHPSSWLTSANNVRQRLASARPDIPPSDVRLGVGLNNNKLCGCVLVGVLGRGLYLQGFPAAIRARQPPIDSASLRSLLYSLDTIGVSAYISLEPNFQPCNIEEVLFERFDAEISFFGITLADLVARGKEIVFLEFGVGGGADQDGNKPATDAVTAAERPYFGVFTNPYKAENDPWKLSNPTSPSEVRDYLRYFYNTSATYFAEGCGPKYNVAAVYIWNLLSWDVQGIYHGSSSSEGSYRDPVTLDIIGTHNCVTVRGKPDCNGRLYNQDCSCGGTSAVTSAGKMTLERMKSILICWSPTFYRTASIREFQSRLSGKRVQATNPDCQIQIKVLTKIEPFVQITYQDDSKQVIRTDALKVDDIMAKINQRTERMDLKQLFEEAGWKDINIISNKDELPAGQKRNQGKMWNVPRDAPE